MTKPLHVWEAIQDELAVRGWTLEQLAWRMSDTDADFGVNLLSLEFCEIKDKRLTLGDALAQGLAKAFGTSTAMWMNIDKLWCDSQASQETTVECPACGHETDVPLCVVRVKCDRCGEEYETRHKKAGAE